MKKIKKVKIGKNIEVEIIETTRPRFLPICIANFLSWILPTSIVIKHNGKEETIKTGWFES